MFAERPNIVISGVLLIVMLGATDFIGKMITDAVDNAVTKKKSK